MADKHPENRASGLEGSSLDGSDETDRLARSLIAGDPGLCEALFAAEGADKPDILWNPKPDQLEDERLRAMLEVWNAEFEGAGCIPGPDFVEPLRFRKALGYMMLLDVEQGGRDFRYRLYGTEISRRFMRDLTGRLVSEVPFKLSRVFFLAVYQAALVLRTPMFTKHAPPSLVHVTSWSRLILPLSSDGAEVDRFLVGNIPGTWRGGDEVALAR
jgi:hypothetical protein